MKVSLHDRNVLQNMQTSCYSEIDRYQGILQQ